MGYLMSIRNMLLAVAAVATLVPSAESAEGIEGRWSVSLQGGTDVEVSGNVHEGGSGTVLALPTSVEARAFSDVYDPSFRGQASIGYGVGPRSEVFLRGSYYKTSSNTLQVGTVAGLVLNADFADYEEWGGELGYRYYFTADQPLKPYLSLVAGLRSISELPSTFSVPAAGVVLSDVPFYEKSTVAVFGGDLGFSYDVSENVGLGIEAGLRYQSGPSDVEGLAGTGLEPINDTGSRWSVPVLATVTFRF
jgi:hypothetical protein